MQFIFKVHKIPEVTESLCGVVRVPPETEIIIKQLQREMGLSKSAIVAQVMAQVEGNYKIEEV